MRMTWVVLMFTTAGFTFFTRSVREGSPATWPLAATGVEAGGEKSMAWLFRGRSRRQAKSKPTTPEMAAVIIKVLREYRDFIVFSSPSRIASEGRPRLPPRAALLPRSDFPSSFPTGCPKDRYSGRPGEDPFPPAGLRGSEKLPGGFGPRRPGKGPNPKN